MDGWYWCPESVVERRIETERERLKDVINRPNIYYGFQTWEQDQSILEARLAHACHDGRIRAASGWGVEYFHTAGGTVRIYGKCRFCNSPLSDGIKAIIIMEREL